MSSGITGDANTADRERGRMDLEVPGELSASAVLTRRELWGAEATSSGSEGESQLYHQWGASPSLYGVPNDAYLAESDYKYRASREISPDQRPSPRKTYRCKARGGP